MAKISAGLILYRKRKGNLEVLLVHPGGPIWAKRDLGAWSIPKGEIDNSLTGDYLSTAKREFEEELGFPPPAQSEFISLGSITQKAGKTVYAWAFEENCDTKSIKSNTFTMEWPPHSEKQQQFPEVDRAEFFGIEEAKKKINPAQVYLLLTLQEKVTS